MFWKKSKENEPNTEKLEESKQSVEETVVVMGDNVITQAIDRNLREPVEHYIKKARPKKAEREELRVGVEQNEAQEENVEALDKRVEAYGEEYKSKSNVITRNTVSSFYEEEGEETGQHEIPKEELEIVKEQIEDAYDKLGRFEEQRYLYNNRRAGILQKIQETISKPEHPAATEVQRVIAEKLAGIAAVHNITLQEEASEEEVERQADAVESLKNFQEGDLDTAEEYDDGGFFDDSEQHSFGETKEEELPEEAELIELPAEDFNEEKISDEDVAGLIEFSQGRNQDELPDLLIEESTALHDEAMANAVDSDTEVEQNVAMADLFNEIMQENTDALPASEEWAKQEIVAETSPETEYDTASNEQHNDEESEISYSTNSEEYTPENLVAEHITEDSGSFVSEREAALRLLIGDEAMDYTGEVELGIFNQLAEEYGWNSKEPNDLETAEMS